MADKAIEALGHIRDAETAQKKALAEAREKAALRRAQAQALADGVEKSVEQKLQALSQSIQEEVRKQGDQQLEKLEEGHRKARLALQEAAKSRRKTVKEQAFQAFVSSNCGLSARKE